MSEFDEFVESLVMIYSCVIVTMRRNVFTETKKKKEKSPKENAITFSIHKPR